MVLQKAQKSSVRKGASLQKLNRFGYLFVLPFVVVFLTFHIYPFFRTLYLSFTSYKGYGTPDFTGLNNYTRVISDRFFWQALLNTVKIWGVNIVLQLGLALILTIIFNDMKYRFRGLGVFRAMFYLPNLIACTSVAFLFQTLLDWKFGTVNQVLLSTGIIRQGINWMETPATVQMVVAVVGAWMWFGNSFLLLMAGVQGINKDYFEAAVIDGAGRWRIFGSITMPLLKPIMLYVAVTSLIGGLQLFDLPFLMSKDGMGAPDKALNTVVVYLYNMAFRNHQIGYAAAIAFMLFLIIAVCSALTYKMMYGKKEA